MTVLSQAIKQSYDQVSPKSVTKARPKRVVPTLIRMTGMGFNLLSILNLDLSAQKLSDLWFTVFKSRPRDSARTFWSQADHRVEIHLSDKVIPVYLWGQGPLVVCMHGWSGSGTQFRSFIPSLVEAGYQVAVFDAPAHGFNLERRTHVLEFSQSLLAIQEQISPVHTVIAHSFGAMASLLACQYGLKTERQVLISPGMDVQEIFESYCGSLNLNAKLAERFHQKVGQEMSDIALIDDPWEYFQPAKLLQYVSPKGLIIFDHADEEISQSQFQLIEKEWSEADVHRTRGLGHFRILKDSTVVNKVTDWLNRG